MAMPHGGALKLGGNPGNAGGTGRPPNEVRRALRAVLETRGLDVVQEIINNPAVDPGDRLRAVELAARYGLGTSDQVSSDVTVREAVTPAEVDAAAAAARRKLGLVG